MPEYIRPLFCEGKGPFRWAALSGDPADIAATDRLALEMFADDEPLCRWIRLAAERVAFQGLPARIFWLGYGERARFGLAINDLVGRGVVSAPIVIGRDHLDAGSVASPNRETEGMRDGSDAIADWPVLNALLNTSSGATWVSVHHGGGVGIGYSLHAGMVVVADGTREADEKLERVLTCDPGLGVVRHADAGYPEAIADGARARHRHALMRPRGAAMMIPERPSLERRVLAALDGSQATRSADSRGARRLRIRADVAAVAAARPDRAQARAQYIDFERVATTPERFLTAIRRRAPFPARPTGQRPPEAGAREAFDASLAFLDTARAPGDVPATFLLDEVLDIRTFESFPGLRARAARSRRRAGRERQPVRAGVALHRARAPAAARRAGAVRGHARAAAVAGGNPRHRRVAATDDGEDGRPARDDLAPARARALRRPAGVRAH